MDSTQTNGDEEVEYGRISGLLFKFGQRAHLEALRRGLLYMNSESFFARLKDDELRSDKLEGLDEIHQPHAVKRLTVSGILGMGPLDLTPFLSGPVGLCRGGAFRNLFCMYLAPIEPGWLNIDPRCEQFGDSFLILTDLREFAERFHAAARRAGLNSEGRCVEYFDAATYSGEVGYFKKSDRFLFQREFRLAVWPGKEGHIELDLGDLADITSPVSDLAGINSRARIEIA